MHGRVMWTATFKDTIAYLPHVSHVSTMCANFMILWIYTHSPSFAKPYFYMLVSPSVELQTVSNDYLYVPYVNLSNATIVTRIY